MTAPAATHALTRDLAPAGVFRTRTCGGQVRS